MDIGRKQGPAKGWQGLAWPVWGLTCCNPPAGASAQVQDPISEEGSGCQAHTELCLVALGPAPSEWAADVPRLNGKRAPQKAEQRASNNQVSILESGNWWVPRTPLASHLPGVSSQLRDPGDGAVGCGDAGSSPTLNPAVPCYI